MFSKKETNNTQNVKIKSIIGEDAIVEGTLSAKETTRVDGQIKGDVEIGEVLVLGVTGKILGNVTASSIMVGGMVEGDLVAKDKIVISATGKVIGNIRSKKLVVDENGVFRGQCFMGDEPTKQIEEVREEAVTAAPPVRKTGSSTRSKKPIAEESTAVRTPKLTASEPVIRAAELQPTKAAAAPVQDRE